MSVRTYITTTSIKIEPQLVEESNTAGTAALPPKLALIKPPQLALQTTATCLLLLVVILFSF